MYLTVDRVKAVYDVARQETFNYNYQKKSLSNLNERKKSTRKQYGLHTRAHILMGPIKIQCLQRPLYFNSLYIKSERNHFVQESILEVPVVPYTEEELCHMEIGNGTNSCLCDECINTIIIGKCL